MQRRQLVRAAGAALALPALARAQAYPSRPIRYIVPVPAGGGNDMIARVVTERWSRLLGQPFVVDNQGGGSGVVACQTTARAAPDGYTLLQAYVATHGTNPATRRVPYDPVKDFTPIGMVGASPNVLVVHAGVPARSLQEFIDLARRSGGKLSYGSAGLGTLTHLTMELFKHDTGASLLHVPYRGAAPAIADAQRVRNACSATWSRWRCSACRRTQTGWPRNSAVVHCATLQISRVRASWCMRQSCSGPAAAGRAS
jgi:tripartite-type tricarboxylate transporter receptor subunit TctC